MDKDKNKDNNNTDSTETVLINKEELRRLTHKSSVLETTETVTISKDALRMLMHNTRVLEAIDSIQAPYESDFQEDWGNVVPYEINNAIPEYLHDDIKEVIVKAAECEELHAEDGSKAEVGTASPIIHLKIGQSLVMQRYRIENIDVFHTHLKHL